MPSDLELLIGCIEKTEEDFVEIHKKLVGYFIRRGFSDSEDLANKTLDRVAHHVAIGKVNDLKSVTGYCINVAHYIAKEEWGKQKRKSAPQMVSVDDPDNPIRLDADDKTWPDNEIREREEDALAAKKRTCMGKCFDELREEDKLLLSMNVRQGDRTAAENRAIDRRRERGCVIKPFESENAKIRAIYRYREDIKSELQQCLRRCMHSDIKKEDGR